MERCFDPLVDTCPTCCRAKDRIRSMVKRKQTEFFSTLPTGTSFCTGMTYSKWQVPCMYTESVFLPSGAPESRDQINIEGIFDVSGCNCH